jgi:hypothetical protein
MASTEPISGDPDDEATAERLRAFFSAASAAEGAASPGAGPGTDLHPPDLQQRPAPTGRPVFDPLRTEAANPVPGSVEDVAGLVRYLDAQLELTRRRTADGVEQVLAGLADLTARVGDLEASRAGDDMVAEALVSFRNELFQWLEGYVSWEAGRLAELDQRIDGGPPPTPPPAH